MLGIKEYLIMVIIDESEENLEENEKDRENLKIKFFKYSPIWLENHIIDQRKR